MLYLRRHGQGSRKPVAKSPMAMSAVIWLKKTMKWRHFWRQGEGLGPPDAKQVFQESRVYENTMNMKSFISLDREHFSPCLLFLIDNSG